MKIWEIMPTLNVGGGETMVVELSNELNRQGHECSIITLFDFANEQQNRGKISPEVRVSSLRKRNGFDVKSLFRLAKWVRKESPDIVHLHLGAITYILIAALFVRKTKYVATIHSDANFEAGNRFALMIRKFLFKFRLVQPVTISEESNNSFRELYKNIDTKIIYNGLSYPIINEQVYTDYLKYKDGVDYLFVHVASIQPVKNQLMLVEAFEKLLRHGVKARLLFIGRAPARKPSQEIYHQLLKHFSEEIVYLGEQQNIRSIMSVCDAFCLSSKLEGMPMTIIEAMSVGCVPIVTPVGGCVNMVQDGENGFVSKEITSESYYDAMMRFVNNNHHQQLRKKAIECFEHLYSVERVCHSYVDLFQQMKSR